MRLDNIKLNSHQKTVLAIVCSAATPTVAASDVVRTSNLNAAALLLDKLGIIVYNSKIAEITEYGGEIAVEENITDANGQLTTNGTVYLKMASMILSGDVNQGPVAESLLLQLLQITHGVHSGD